MEDRFTYGYDVNAYIDEAIKRLRKCHPWVTIEHFRPEYSYAIETENGEHVFARYFKSVDTSERNIVEGDGEAFVKQIKDDQEWWVEINNDTTERFELDFPGDVDICGWTLEGYEFRKHKFGGISSWIQAGDRTTGGSREFFLPASFFEGTFDEFLEKYNNFVAGCFSLPVKWAKDCIELQEFLGFSSSTQ